MKIKLLIINSSYILQKLILKLISKLLFRKINANNIGKILIFRTGSLGDNLCTLPAINSIRERYQQQKIHILYHSGKTPTLSIINIIDNNIIDKFIDYKNISTKSLIKLLKKEKYSVFVELPQVHATLWSKIRNIFFAKLIGAKYIAKQVIFATHIFPQTQSKYRQFTNVRDVFFDIAKSIGAESRKNVFPLQKTDIDKKIVTNIISDYNLINKNRNIAIVVGAKRSQNMWGIDNFNNVITHFSRKNHNLILIGGNKESLMVKELLSIPNVFDFTGKLTPIQSGLLMQNCILTITNDTGPMHLSYAFGTYTITIFSSRDYPDLWFPPQNLSYVFRNNSIHCHTCFSETCKNNICMKEITPEDVINKAEKVINSNNF